MPPSKANVDLSTLHWPQQMISGKLPAPKPNAVTRALRKFYNRSPLSFTPWRHGYLNLVFFKSLPPSGKGASCDSCMLVNLRTSSEKGSGGRLSFGKHGPVERPKHPNNKPGGTGGKENKLVGASLSPQSRHLILLTTAHDCEDEASIQHNAATRLVSSLFQHKFELKRPQTSIINVLYCPSRGLTQRKLRTPLHAQQLAQ